MPRFDVELDDGTVMRVEAADATEATAKGLERQGQVIPQPVRPGPGEGPVFSPPRPTPPDATVYIPPAPTSEASRQRPLMDPVVDWFAQKVVPQGMEMGKKAVIPTVTSQAMRYGGGMVPGLRALPPEAREGIGSAVGTGINMALGIEEPSMTNLAMSAVTPTATRSGSRYVTSKLPGAAAAGAAGLSQEAAEIPGRISRNVMQADVDKLFDQARQLNPNVSMASTQGMANRLFQAERGLEVPALKFGDIEGIAQGLEAAVKRHGGDIPLAQLDNWRRRIGARINVAENSEEQRALKALYSSVMSDLETAAAQVGGAGAAALRQGITDQRRLFAAKDLESMISTATSKPRQVDELTTVDFGSLIKTLEHPRTQQQTLLADFLEQHPQEQKEVLDLLHDMNQRNVKLLPPAGSTYGSGGFWGRSGKGFLATKALNTLAGEEILDPATGGMIAGAGSEVISRALMTPTGRAMLKQMYTETGTLNVTDLATQFLGQTGRANLGPPGLDLAQRASTKVTGWPGGPVPAGNQPRLPVVPRPY
jgi:hypothetical protein